ncbi:hypothetical protein [Muriicola sp. Z0-33]|uniref:hypothetical protein n=1 Tax=Muriicola sp. Z0-33 TaxID=2816957 RepID=UPI002237DC7D|nr:hypothetical protein [Muriicola sp. Z0-33]MCW5517678.1 hypothetical protein [Muriicola sp. Z0-33]
MDKMMYLAAQYLAAAGISFLDKIADDSHTNLGFVTGNASLNTRQLNQEGDVLSLNYERFTLNWNGKANNESIRLDGNTHQQIVNWIEDQARQAAMEQSYTFNFHYDLPYDIEDNFTFKLLDASRLSELTHLRILAQLVLEKFLSAEGLTSEIRVWPHHFDTGVYAIDQQDAALAIGAGLAIPDTVADEHYFYLSVYKNHKAIATENLDPLSNGRWHSKGFVGAVLPAKNETVETVLAFYEQALADLKSLV